jgi:stage IV sporulation protein FB
MKWSWKLTRLAGIDVHVHATFFILVAWIGLSYWLVKGSPAAVIGGVGFILALLGFIWHLILPRLLVRIPNHEFRPNL